VFLLPGETMDASVEFAGYTAVRHLRPQNGAELKGWVRSERLAPAASLARAPASAPAVGGVDCAAVASAAAQGRRDIATAAARRVVTGTGRLQFHAAPDLACRQSGVFILTGEAVEALAQFGDFTSVRYLNPRTGAEARGWVQSGRLAAARLSSP
jgi:hypothetical protein